MTHSFFTLMLGQTEKGSWYFYVETPAKAIMCYGPYRQDMEDARRDAATFLFNFNLPHCAVGYIDQRIKPHPSAAVRAAVKQEAYLEELLSKNSLKEEEVLPSIDELGPEHADFSKLQSQIAKTKAEEAAIEEKKRRRSHLTLVE